MSIIIDLIIIGIILLTVLISAKQGFVKIVIGVAGFIAAVLLAFSLSGPLANLTYQNVIEPPIVNSVAEDSSGSASETVDKIWDSLPNVITDNADSLGISKESIIQSVEKETQTTAQGIIGNVSQNVIKPVLTGILETVFAVILIIVLLFVVKILAKLINKVFSFSVVGKLNRTLGGVVGLVKGLLIALIACEVILLIISFTKNGIWIFNNENIEKTFIFKFLINVF